MGLDGLCPKVLKGSHLAALGLLWLRAMRHLLIIPWGMLALANPTEVRAGDSLHPTAPPALLSSVFVSELWIVQKNLQPYLFDYILTQGLQCKARPVLRITYNKRDHLYLGSCGSAFGWGVEGVGACLVGTRHGAWVPL